jgi:hypothetical protein
VPRGSFCVSIDLELAWGIWDKPQAAYFRACAEKERAIVDALLAIFERHQVAVTWAVVGRLLERAAPVPVETEHGDRIWYAPDLIDRIRAAKPAHDVGSHSYGHVYFGETPRDRIADDLARAREVHARHGIGLASFVFPRNQVAHVDLLAAAGVRVFRSVDHGWHIAVRERAGRVPGRVANLADKVLPVPPATVAPRPADDGLVELPSSMLLLARDGLRRLVHPEAAVLKAKLGLARARRRGETFHLWFHPSNFYSDTERQLGVLDRIVSAAAAARDAGTLDVRTMQSFAA